MKVVVLVLTFLSYLFHISLAITNEDLSIAAAASKFNIIHLDDVNFEYFLATPRDSYILTLFTTEASEFGCTACTEFESEFKNIVQSWFQDHPKGASITNGDKSLFFTRSSVKDSKHIPDLFNFFEITHVPRLLLFPPGQNIKDYHVIDMGSGKGMDRIIKVLNAVQNISHIEDIRIYDPINWVKVITLGFITFIIVSLTKKYKHVAENIFKHNLFWGIIWTFFIISMISGSMFNKINNVRYSGIDKTGEILFFMKGEFQNQFAVESQILSVLYSLITMTVVGLVVVVSYLSKSNTNTDKSHFKFILASVSLAILLYILFSGLTTSYKMKSNYYPFPLMKISSFFNSP